MAKKNILGCVDITIKHIATGGALECFVGSQGVVQHPTPAARLGGVGFIGDDHAAPGMGLGLVDQALPKPVVGPGAHGPGRFAAKTSLALLHHGLRFKHGKKHTAIRLAKPLGQLLVQLIHKVSDL